MANIISLVGILEILSRGCPHQTTRRQWICRGCAKDILVYLEGKLNDVDYYG